jgi:hypothetical protein
LGGPSPLHDERIVRWVKFITHAFLDGDGSVKFQTRPIDNWLGYIEESAWFAGECV